MFLLHTEDKKQKKSKNVYSVTSPPPPLFLVVAARNINEQLNSFGMSARVLFYGRFGWLVTMLLLIYSTLEVKQIYAMQGKPM